eukprot:GHUV01008811.1.p2 GENE.GHUV01008811.1~~GHUV01008811.1.p2  ORF type:complete len:107 (+),score=3.08 GHUV01008811.1:1442-1762(+)
MYPFKGQMKASVMVHLLLQIVQFRFHVLYNWSTSRFRMAGEFHASAEHEQRCQHTPANESKNCAHGNRMAAVLSTVQVTAMLASKSITIRFWIALCQRPLKGKQCR